MKKHLIPGLTAIIILLGSCKKDNNSNTTGIQGTYKLLYLNAKTTSTVSSTDGGKTVTNSHYTTINNAGTLVFTSSNLTATGLAYTVDTVATGYFYQDNVLTDSTSFPFTFTLPPSTSTGTYSLIGADSIYFPEGSLTSGVNGSGSIQGGASGGRYTLNGKILTLTQIASKDSTFDDSGETVHLSESAVSNAVMEKQ